MEKKFEILKKYVFNFFYNERKDLVSTEKISLMGINEEKEVTVKYFILNKILYFIQLNYYLISGQKLVDKNFRSYKNGSVLMRSDMGALNELFNFNESDLKVFNEDELDCINKTLNYFKQFELNEIIELNHIEPAWRFFYKNDSFDDIIDFNLVKEQYKKSFIIKRYLEKIGLLEKFSLN